MNGLPFSSIADIVRKTAPTYLNKLTYSLLATRYTQCYAVNMMKDKSEPDDGNPLEFRVATDLGTNIGTISPFQTVEVTASNNAAVGTERWGSKRISWAIDTTVKALQTTDAKKIVDYADSERELALAGGFESIEDDWWKCRSSDDGVRIHEMPYWIVKSNSATADPDGNVSDGTSAVGGFTGNQAYGTTNPGGISHARWRNYANKYTSLGWSDLGKKIMVAMKKCDFRNPVPMATSTNGEPDWGFYTNMDVTIGLVDQVRSNNDRLGYNILAGSNSVTIQGNKVTWIPALDADTDDPFYGLNWKSWKIKTLKTMWMKEETYDPIPTQPTVITSHLMSFFQDLCVNRRLNFVLSTGTAYVG